MKIYVDELPKSCKECPLYRSGRLKVKKGSRYIDAETCVLGNFYKFQEIDNEIDTCPLETTQSLKQQVREEVVEEINKQLAQENQQLKKQLAESKEENKKLVKALNGDIFINYKVPMENAKLKQQLAEKEKEIEYQESMKILAVKNQNQKAIEQLEKVKEFFLEEHRDEEMDTDYIITKDAGEIADFLLEQIKQLKDQQINELKGNVEDER